MKIEYMRSGIRINASGKFFTIVQVQIDQVIAYDEENPSLKILKLKDLDEALIVKDLHGSGEIYNVDGRPFMKLLLPSGKALFYPLDLPGLDFSKATLAHPLLANAKSVTPWRNNA